MNKNGKFKYKRYLYHVTENLNTEKILSEGLIRGGMPRKTMAVYLSMKPLSWWRPGTDILRIDTKGLEGEWSDFLPYNDEILYWGDIDPKRIKVYEPNAIQHIEMFNRMRVE